MTVDWAKTSPWRRLPTRSATCKNPFFAYSDRLGERSERCALGLQFITIAKAPCQAFAAAASKFFSTARRAPAFFRPTRMRSLWEIPADERAARFAPRCTNLVSDHRRGSLVVGGRRNRRGVRRGLARFRAAPRGGAADPVPPFSPQEFPAVSFVVP